MSEADGVADLIEDFFPCGDDAEEDTRPYEFVQSFLSLKSNL
jgi:hypothetical protein